MLTGIGTVKDDDPRLTVREVETPRQPLRVIVDSRLETPEDARILEGGGALIFCAVESSRKLNAEIQILPNPHGKVELPKMLEELARRGVNELHVEAGFRLNGSLRARGLRGRIPDLPESQSARRPGAGHGVDLPGFGDLEKRPKLKIQSLDRVGDDIRILARL